MVFLLKATLGATVGSVQVSHCCHTALEGIWECWRVDGVREMESVVSAMHWILALPYALEAVAEQWLKKTSAEVLMLWQYFSELLLSQQLG